MGYVDFVKKSLTLGITDILASLIFNTNNINKHHMPSIFVLKAML